MTREVKRALISVSDKTNIEELVKYLIKQKVEIISTGGTYSKLKEIAPQTKEISTYTGFPEIMNGRVKTLNPKIHGGILADRTKEEHVKAMQEHGILGIDLVVVNLYPFEETVASGADDNKVIENIDVGGPTMIRAAAKNHQDVIILTDPNDYQELLKELQDNDNKTTPDFRKKMAAKAFSKTANYDAAIASWFLNSDHRSLSIDAKLKQKLRYGENPHQKAELYQVSDSGIVSAKQIQGKELSYNNINDADNAYLLIQDFKEPTAAIIKHANPCGVASAVDICSAYKKALSADPLSSFGGIIALNRELNEETAEVVKQTFFEVIIAPSITSAARNILSGKKNMRILLQSELQNSQRQIKTVSGGFLVQDNDFECLDKGALQIVTERAPNEAEIKNMIFGFRLVKHVKSNAILFAKDQMSLGIGAGQMSRVDSVRMATLKLEDYKKQNNANLENMIVASDAFFPFPDGLELAVRAGATAAIQPGGSVRDQEVIDTANRLGVAMAFTGIRHFKH